MAQNSTGSPALDQWLDQMYGNQAQPQTQQPQAMPMQQPQQQLNQAVVQGVGGQQGGNILEDLLKNNQQYNVKSISHDEKGGAKVEFNPPNQNANTIQEQAQPTPQVNTSTSAIATPQQTTRAPASSPFAMGSETEQPGMVWNMLNFLAGGGLPKPQQTTAQALLTTLMGQQTKQTITGTEPIQPAKQQEIEIQKQIAQKNALQTKFTGLHQEAANLISQMSDITKSNSLWSKTWGTATKSKQYTDLKNQLDKVNKQIDETGTQLGISGQQNQGKNFKSEAEAIASGIKGEVTINGRPARID